MIGSKIGVNFRSVRLTYCMKDLVNKCHLGDLLDQVTLHLSVSLLGGGNGDKVKVSKLMSIHYYYFKMNTYSPMHLPNRGRLLLNNFQNSSVGQQYCLEKRQDHGTPSTYWAWPFCQRNCTFCLPARRVNVYAEKVDNWHTTTNSFALCWPDPPQQVVQREQAQSTVLL